MWYAVMSTDVPDSLGLRADVRDAHLARLKILASENRLLVAGPHPAIDSEEPGESGFTGSLVVVDFPSLAAAQQWADSDPYCAAGVYQDVIVKPFKLVLP